MTLFRAPIKTAAGALEAGDPLGALNRVACATGAPAAGTSKERHSVHPTLNARADVDSVSATSTNLPSTGLCRRRTVEIDSRHGVGVKRDGLVIQPFSGTFHEVRIGCRALELVGSKKSNAGADRRIRKLH